MFKSQRATGLVIASIDRGEADRFLTVYSREFGKIKIIAKSVRKITSKLYGGTGLFNLVEIEFVEGKVFRTMTDYRKLKSFDRIKSNPLRTRIGYDICEIIDLLIEKEQKDNRIWPLTKQSFQLLDETKADNNTWLICYQYFFWNLMSLLGYRPDTDRCYLCKKKLTPRDMAFNPVNGGVKCFTCLSQGYFEHEIKVSTSAVKILRLIIKGRRDTLQKIKPNSRVEEELKGLLDSFLKYHFSVSIK
ncbi:MAG: DNA repair protein RecO [bacterium]